MCICDVYGNVLWFIIFNTHFRNKDSRATAVYLARPGIIQLFRFPCGGPRWGSRLTQLYHSCSLLEVELGWAVYSTVNFTYRFSKAPLNLG